MAIIDFKQLVFDYSDESFTALKDSLDFYFWSYYISRDEMTKPVFLEKIGEYLRYYELQTKLRDNDLAYSYSSFLLPFLENRIVTAKPGNAIQNKAEKYYNRLKTINDQIKSAEDKSIMLEKLEDFTKVFLCLYSNYIKSKKPVSTVDFHVSYIDIENLIEDLTKDRPEGKKLEDIAPDAAKMFIPTNIFRSVDDIKKGLSDVQRGIQDAQRGISDEIKKRIIKEDTLFEPVHDYIEFCQKHEIYTIESFVIIMLKLMYYRIKDFEQGLN